MSKQIEALKLALEALTNAYWPTNSDLMPAHNIKECADAITAIKEALMSVPDGAQPETEYHAVNAVHKGQQCYVEAQPAQDTNHSFIYTLPSKAEPIPYGEPIGILMKLKGDEHMKLYSFKNQSEPEQERCRPNCEALLQKFVAQRKPLTDEEIADLWGAQIFHVTDLKLAIDFVRDIERAHGIYAPTERKGKA